MRRLARAAIWTLGSPSEALWAARISDAPSKGRGRARLRRSLLRWRGGAKAFARRHWLFILVFAAGTGLRVVVSLAYRPALLNSVEYLNLSARLRPGTVHPVVYPLFLRLFPRDLLLPGVPIVQHALGLAIAAIIYVALLRNGVKAWAAALASAPVLFDAYQLSVEQYLTAETLFELLVLGACALLVWTRPLPATLAGLAGLLAASAAVTRTIGGLLVVPAVLTLLFLRAGITRVALLLALFVAPLLAYAGWYDSVHGRFALSGTEGHFLYGRVASFVDCGKFSVRDYERPLCLNEPPGQRAPMNDLIWGRFSRLRRLHPPPGKTKDEVARAFAERAIRHQPRAYVAAVRSDILRSFAPTRRTVPGEFGEPPWEFHERYPTFVRGSICSREMVREVRVKLGLIGPELAAGREAACKARERKVSSYIERYGARRSINGPLIAFLRRFQRVAYTPGPLLAACLLAGVAAALGLGRARRSSLRAQAFLFSGSAIAVCLGIAFVTDFSWRYQVPQLVLLPPAGALGFTALLRRPETTET